jgi:hypothetical protein
MADTELDGQSTGNCTYKPAMKFETNQQVVLTVIGVACFSGGE